MPSLHKATCAYLSALMAAGVVAMLSAAQRPQQAPDFAVSTTRVLLDVVARDTKHRTVAGLQVSDFRIEEDGKPREIVSFQEVRHPERSGDSKSAAALSTVAPVAPNNTAGRRVAIVLEELGPEARASVGRLDESLQQLMKSDPDVAVAIFVYSGSLYTGTEFTNDPTAVQTALRTALQRPGCPLFETQLGHRQAQFTNCVAWGEGTYHRIRGVNTFAALRQLVLDMAPLPGRKAIALYSEGLDLTSGSRGQFGDDRMSWFESLIAASAASHVAFYTFDAAGLRLHSTATGQLMEEPRAALSVLARRTGGDFAEGTNDLQLGLRRMWADTGNYYMLAFDSVKAPSSSQKLRVRVTTSRRGIRLLSRDQYVPVQASSR